MLNSDIGKGLRRQSGYALLSTLILLFILTAIAIGMFYSSLAERNNATADMEHNKAFYGAEAAMEKMTADLGTLYQNEKSPSIPDIDGIATASHYPVVPGVNFRDYSIQVPASPDNPTMPDGVVQTISSGPNAGLYAQLIRMTLSATAETAGGTGAAGSIAGLEQVRMTRNVEVALIPVFQFGVFCQNDCDFFNGPPFDFGGRTFANGNIFLATGQGLTFHSKVQAVQQIVRNALENGEDSTTNWNGKVDVPTAPNGCDGAQPACRQLQSNEESTHGFFGANGQRNPNPPRNPNWPGISNQTYAGMLQNGDTGVKPLNLAFVQPGVTPYEIIRRPYPDAEPATSSTGSSRLYNQAQIRILLADDPLKLPKGPKPEDRQLDFYPNYPTKPLPVGAQDPPLGPAAVAGPGLLTQSMAQGIQLPQPTDGKGHCIDPKNNIVKCAGWDAAWVNRLAGQPLNAAWPLISGWLRVEYRDASGQYHNITQEWLNLGFARQGQVAGPTPNSEAGIANTVHPKAILLFQFPADQFVANAGLQYNWYPINMYDPREGEVRDKTGATINDCAVGGLLNVIELDMNNLRLWLNGTIPGSGSLVESKSQNGYIVYFSDRRGMQLDPLSPFPTELDGEYGFNDVVNIADPNGAPNGTLDAGEDVDGDGKVHNSGTTNIGIGFGLPALGAAKNPYTVIGTGRIANCSTTGRVNQVTGPRHVFRVVNGSLGNVPLTPAGTGGTTIASENSVYVLGNYNANNGGFGDVAEAGSAVIADALTLLSNNYTDLKGLSNPTTRTARLAGTTWYRLAVAAGKNPPFPAPPVAGFGYGANPTDFGTDGGIHNFLRYIEDWGGQTLNYQGSLVSFYYSRQAVGVFKCCNVVYSPPSRNYSFDTKFLDPAFLPPGTPRFQDIDNLGYHQDFRPQ